MTTQELLAEAAANFAGWVGLLGTHIEGGASFEVDGAPLASTGMAEAPPNGVVIAQRLAGAETIVARALAYFDGRGFAGSSAAARRR